MKKLLLPLFLLLSLVLFGQSTTPNLGMTWPAHLGASGTWDSNVVGNSSIVDNIFGIPDCGDSTHAVGWSLSQKKLTCQTIAGTGVGSAFSVIGAGTNTVALRMGPGGSLDTAGGTINASSLLNGTWAVPGPIGNTVPNSGAFTWLNSDLTIDAASFTGSGLNRWTDKVVAAYNSAACTGILGCTIIVPDSIADDGSATTPVIPSVVSLVFPGNGAFTMCKMSLTSDTNFSAKLYGHAFLKYTGSNCSLSQVGFKPLQTIDKFVIKGISILCQSATNSTGITLANNAEVDLEDISISGCTNAGILVSEAQFGTMNAMNIYNNTVGIKMYPSNANGGANSWTISNSTIENNTVGYIQSAVGLTFGQGSNILSNVNFLTNSVAAIATFGGGGGFFSTLYIWGGAPEANASGAATVTIDGNVVKRASLYSNFTDVYIHDETIAEAAANPVFIIENKTHLVVNNMCCYGSPTGRLVSADTTSSAEFHGRFSTNGYVDNVVSFPDIIGQATDFSMQGPARLRLDTKIQQDYAGNPMTPAFVDITGSVSQAIVSDPLYGPVSTVTHAASVGNTSTNRVNFGNIMSTTTSVTSDYLVCGLMQSSTNGPYQLFGNASFAIGMAPIHPLPGWNSVCMYGQNVPAGQSVQLVGFPLDSSGPTVSFTGLEVAQAPSGSPAALALMGFILKTGAVNPNLGNCSGVGTAASPSVAACGNASQGNFSCATAATGATCQVNTTRVTANSQIYVQEDETQGTKLGVTCNTSTNVLPVSRLLASKTAGSFTINLGTVTTNPGCFSFRVDN